MIKTRIRIHPYLFWVALFAPLLGVSIFIFVEYSGYVNYVEPGPPYEMQTVAQIVGASGSIFLTYGLVILYRQQAQIQSNQENLMKNDHKPKVELVHARVAEDRGDIMLKLSNSGKGTATNLEASVEIYVDTEIDAHLIPKWQKLTRVVENHPQEDSNDIQQIFHSSGEYLSPEEGEVDFRYSDRIDGRQLDGGEKTIDNASFSSLIYYFAQVNNDKLDPIPPVSHSSRDIINSSLDFDRLRVKYSLRFEDIDGKPYQRTIMDYLVPAIYDESKITYFKLGMSYELYVKRQQQPFYQRNNIDPLEYRVENHFELVQGAEEPPSSDDS